MLNLSSVSDYFLLIRLGFVLLMHCPLYNRKGRKKTAGLLLVVTNTLRNLS